MKDGTFAIIVDNDNQRTLDFRNDLAEKFVSKKSLMIMDKEWMIVEADVTPITEDNRGRQTVFILDELSSEVKADNEARPG